MSGSRWPVLAARATALAAVVMLFGVPGCSDDARPNPAGFGSGGSGGSGVGGSGGVVTGTCSTDGLVRECHFKVSENDGILSCWVGQQECRGGVWGACQGNVTLSSKPALGAQGAHGAGPSLKPQAMTDAGPTDAAAGCSADPCNPYCYGYPEDPPDITPTYTPGSSYYGNSNEWGNGPPGWIDKQDCGQTGSCSTGYPKDCNGTPTHQNMYDGCLADHHCDLTTDQCVRNSPGFKWPATTCPGIDFTLGPACIQNNKQGYPICNRGNTDVAAGTNVVIKVKEGESGWLDFTTCTPNNLAAYTCTVNLPNGLPAGECLRVVASAPLAAGEVGPCPWGPGNSIAFVNSDAAITECGMPMTTPTTATMPGCSNNWSDIKTGTNTCALFTNGFYSPEIITQTYTAYCPPGTKARWDKLAWDATIGCSPGACNGTNESKITFEAQTAPASNPSALVPAAPVLLASIKTPNPVFCPMSGVSGCPIDVYSTLNGLPVAGNELLTLTVTLTPSPDKLAAPSLKQWEITYSCPPSE